MKFVNKRNFNNLKIFSLSALAFASCQPDAHNNVDEVVDFLKQKGCKITPEKLKSLYDEVIVEQTGHPKDDFEKICEGLSSKLGNKKNVTDNDIKEAMRNIITTTPNNPQDSNNSQKIQQPDNSQTSQYPNTPKTPNNSQNSKKTRNSQQKEDLSYLESLDVSKMVISLNNFVDNTTDDAKNTIIAKLENGDKKIDKDKVVKVIDLGNDAKFFVIKETSMVDYNFDGFMDAGNTSGKGGDGLAGVFWKTFRNHEDGDVDKIYDALKEANGGNSNVGYGECKVLKASWMNNFLKDKDIFYAVGVNCYGKNRNRIVKLQEQGKLFEITIEFLRHTYFKGEGANISLEEIQKILGDNFDDFSKQINCVYQTLLLALDLANKKGCTPENPYSIALNPISTSLWYFPKEPAATMNLAIIQLLAAKEILKNMNCCMMCFNKKNNDGTIEIEDVPYINAINAVLAKKKK